MTAPHDSAAKTVKYFESGGIGCTLEAEREDPPDLWYGWFARGRKEANTLEMTYNTICKDVLFMREYCWNPKIEETHLLIYCIAVSEYKVTSNQTSDEGINVSLLSAVQLLLY